MKGRLLNLGLALGLSLSILVIILGLLHVIGIDISSLIVLGVLIPAGGLIDILLHAVLVFVNGFILGGLIGFFLDHFEK